MLVVVLGGGVFFYYGGCRAADFLPILRIRKGKRTGKGIWVS